MESEISSPTGKHLRQQEGLYSGLLNICLSSVLHSNLLSSFRKEAIF